MIKMQTLGLTLAGAFTTIALGGAATLIGLDFGGVDGLARAWAAVSAARAAVPAEPNPFAAKLQGIGEIDLFATADVPGSDLKIHTGTAYANAHDLAAGTVSSRWCYARRDVTNSSFQPTVALGNQKGTQTPILVQPASIAAADARQLGVTPEALADLSRRLCRFGN